MYLVSPVWNWLESLLGFIRLEAQTLTENITPLQVPAPDPIVPSFVPFAVNTGQCCVPPKSLLRKVYHPYKDPVG